MTTDYRGGCGDLRTKLVFGPLLFLILCAEASVFLGPFGGFDYVLRLREDCIARVFGSGAENSPSTKVMRGPRRACTIFDT